ncbi:hypothetical protein [Rhizobacter sp. P5_C2]
MEKTSVPKRSELKPHPRRHDVAALSAGRFTSRILWTLGQGPDKAVAALLKLFEHDKVTCLDLRGQRLNGQRGMALRALLEHASCPLRELDLSGSALPLTVLRGVAENETLTALKLANARLPANLMTYFHVNALVDVVASKSLTHLDLRGVDLVGVRESAAFAKFCSALGQNKNLEWLELGGTCLGNEQLGHLAAALKAHGQLKYLGLGDNDLCWSDAGADGFMNALFANQSLTHLVLPCPETMQDDFDSRILRMLEKNTTLTVLEPYNTPGRPPQACSSRAHDVRVKLEQNRFDQNRLRGDACDLSIRPPSPMMKCLHEMTPDAFDALLRSQCITRLLLQGARLDEEDVETLAHAIGHPTCRVRELDLTGATFATMGILFEQMQHNTSLRRLCLGGVDVVNERGRFPLQAHHIGAIARFLTRTRTLHTLTLSGQGTLGANAAAFDGLMEALERNVSLKCLDIGATLLPGTHLTLISSALRWHALEYLNLDSNPLCWGPELKAFLKGLAQNESLLKLVLPRAVCGSDELVACLWNMKDTLHLCHLPPFSDEASLPHRQTKRGAIRKLLLDNQRRQAEKVEADQWRVKTLVVALEERNLPRDVTVDTARKLIQVTSANMRI